MWINDHIKMTIVEINKIEGYLNSLKKITGKSITNIIKELSLGLAYPDLPYDELAKIENFKLNKLKTLLFIITRTKESKLFLSHRVHQSSHSMSRSIYNTNFQNITKIIKKCLFLFYQSIKNKDLFFFGFMLHVIQDSYSMSHVHRIKNKEVKKLDIKKLKCLKKRKIDPEILFWEKLFKKNTLKVQKDIDNKNKIIKLAKDIIKKNNLDINTPSYDALKVNLMINYDFKKILRKMLNNTNISMKKIKNKVKNTKYNSRKSSIGSFYTSGIQKTKEHIHYDVKYKSDGHPKELSKDMTYILKLFIKAIKSPKKINKFMNLLLNYLVKNTYNINKKLLNIQSCVINKNLIDNNSLKKYYK